MNKNLTGLTFGRLKVIKFIGHDKKKGDLWECECNCSNHTIKIIAAKSLVRGNTKSCGCLSREATIKRNKDNAKYHPNNKNIFGIWIGMKDRCYNPHHVKFEHYGGRGIIICDEWLEYSNFEKWAIENGFKKGLTIERLDSNGNYCPENCKWATWKEQQNNKRNNKWITYKGKTKTLSQWCEELDLNYGRTKARLNSLHWTVEEAFEREKYSQVALEKIKNKKSEE